MGSRPGGTPAPGRLDTADRSPIRNHRNDLAYITVDVLDQAGDLVPDAVVPVSVTISGPGELAAVGTANPKDVHRFRSRHPKTFHGRCLAIVRPTGRLGDVIVRARAEGLPEATVAVTITK